MGQISEIRTNSQITIPKQIMKKLLLKEGDKIEFEVKEDAIVIQNLARKPDCLQSG